MFNILSLLGKEKKETDVLQNLKTLMRWSNALPAGDVLNAQEQIVQKITAFNRGKSPPDKNNLEMLLHLDDYAYPLQTALCQQYLRNSRMSRVMESRLWHTIYQLYWEMARAYHAIILSYIAAPSSHPIKSEIPQITLRALNHLGNVFKWHYFRYEKPPSKLWLRLHNLYRVAESEGFGKNELRLYQDDTITSCGNQYMRILLLTQLDASALYPKQIEMGDQWLNHWSPLVQPERKFNADTHTFYVTLSDGMGARRIRNKDFPNTCRFISVSGLLDKVCETRRALQHGSTPAQAGLGENRLSESMELLEYAERRWGAIDQREQRKNPRTPNKKPVDVTHGFQTIWAAIQHDDARAKALFEVDPELIYEEMIDMKLYGFVTDSTRIRNRPATPVRNEPTPSHERWIMEDESKHGLGASVPAEANDWLRLDVMVGIRTKRGASWKVGVVRRLARPDSGFCQIGIEILGQQPQVLLAYPDSANSAHDYEAPGQEAASKLLPVPVLSIHRTNHQCELLLEPAQYASGRSFLIGRDPHAEAMQLRDVIEKGDGWLRVRADIVSAQTES